MGRLQERLRRAGHRVTLVWPGEPFGHERLGIRGLETGRRVPHYPYARPGEGDHDGKSIHDANKPTTRNVSPLGTFFIPNPGSLVEAIPSKALALIEEQEEWLFGFLIHLVIDAM